jgi:hypothetical protein
LGKIGYKISLSADDFYNDDLEAFNSGKSAPIANIQYWLNKFLTPYDDTLSSSVWGYEIDMDWSSYGASRSSNEIYEEEYSTWKID